MIYLTEKQLSEYILKYSQRLEDSGLNKDEVEIRLESHLKTNVVIKYTKAWQDRVYKELMYIWTEVPGGYWQLQDLMHSPHVEFEHYSNRSKQSYEKGNVSLSMAKKELCPEQYKFYETSKKFKEIKLKKDKGIYEGYDVEVEGKIIIPDKTHKNQKVYKTN